MLIARHLRRLLATFCTILGLLLLNTIATAQIGYTVQSNGNDHLYAVDMLTGNATDLGPVRFLDAEGLTWYGDRLLAIGGTINELWDITSPPGFVIGPTGDRRGLDAGLATHPVTGSIYNIQGTWGASYLYSVNPATGAATFIGGSEVFADALAISSSGAAFTVDVMSTISLYNVDLATGALSLVGPLGINAYDQAGLDFDCDGVLWMLLNSGRIYTINTATGAATFVSQVNIGGDPIMGIEGLAIKCEVPEPGVFVVAAAFGLVGLCCMRRRR